MGIKVVHFDGDAGILSVDNTEYKITSGLDALILKKEPKNTQYSDIDLKVYKKLVTQTKVKSFPKVAGASKPQATWKWENILKTIVLPGESIPEGCEDIDDADSL